MLSLKNPRPIFLSASFCNPSPVSLFVDSANDSSIAIKTCCISFCMSESFILCFFLRRIGISWTNILCPSATPLSASLAGPVTEPPVFVRGISASVNDETVASGR